MWRVLHRQFCIAEIHQAGRDGLNEFQQYQTVYVELVIARSNAVAFSIIFFKNLSSIVCMHGIRRNITLDGYLETFRNI